GPRHRPRMARELLRERTTHTPETRPRPDRVRVLTVEGVRPWSVTEIKLYRPGTCRLRKARPGRRDRPPARKRLVMTALTTAAPQLRPRAVTCMPPKMGTFTKTPAVVGRATTTEIGILQTPRRSR